MKRILCLALAMPMLFYAVLAGAGTKSAAELHRIGYLGEGSFSAADIDALQKMLRERGYVDGRTFAIETRFAAGKIERLDDLANELVQQGIDLLVAEGLSAGQAARRHTRTIPIVIVSRTESIKPSGNVTGATNLSVDLSVMRLKLLKEIAPQVSRAAVLWHEVHPIAPSYLKKLKQSAQSSGMEIGPHKVQKSGGFDAAFEAMAREKDSGLLVEPQPLFANHLPELVSMCFKARLAAISGIEEFAEAGGLISYGLSTVELWRHTALLIDRVFKRRKPKAGQPDELPAEQPTKFELAINLKTARQLGIAVPQEMLARADKVIK
ncbi:MAG TPA: ABC transporter substrate-binding protein [Candidatus Binatia bacterium]